MKKVNLPLNETGDRSAFKVPENYFVHFKGALNEQIDALEASKKAAKSKPKGIILKMDKGKTYLYIAAMFVFMLFSITMVVNQATKKASPSLGLSVEKSSTISNDVPTAEDYLINSVGTYGITEYYVESENVE